MVSNTDSEKKYVEWIGVNGEKHISKFLIFEPPHDKTNKMDVRPA